MTLKKSWQKIVNNFDLYGSNAPQFNLDRKYKVNTSMGVVLTFFSLAIVVAFLIIKSSHLIRGRKAIITHKLLLDQNILDTDSINLKSQILDEEFGLGIESDQSWDFQIAFSAHNAINPLQKYDGEDMVEWTVQFVSADPQTGSEQIQSIGVHKCD